MDNDHKIKDIIVQLGVVLLDVNEDDRAALGAALNTNGVLSFRKFRKEHVHFLHWIALEACEVLETDNQDSGWSLVNTATTSTAAATDSKPSTSSEGNKNTKRRSLHLFFKDFTGMRYDGNQLTVQAKHRLHSKYEFKEGSIYRFVEFLERKGFLRQSKQKLNCYTGVKEAESDKSSMFSELSKDLVTRLTSVQQTLGIIGERSPSPELADRFEVYRTDPVDDKEWKAFFKPDGSIACDLGRVLKAIFKGGVTEEIRPEVWKYLLGLHKWSNTTAANDTYRRDKSVEYYQMKRQWTTFQACQERNFTGFRERRCAIEREAKETDTSFNFYSGPDNRNLVTLRDILMTFQMYNFDLNYASGMNELAAPTLSVVKIEADAFWCFAGFMEKVIDNFDFSKAEMKEQREQLATLLRFVNRKLWRFLKDHASESNMYFCCRWLEVWFKREFSYPDIMRLWEVLWTGVPCKNFHLFVAAAILEQETDAIVDGQLSTHHKLVQHVENIAGSLNVTAILELAEGLYRQVKTTLDLDPGKHQDLRDIFPATYDL